MLGSAIFRTGVAPGGALAGPWVRNPLWTRARAVPSLDLRFADNKSLVNATTGASLVTFTRASSGTYVGSDGLIKTAVTNLLVQSQNFSTSWSNTGSTSTSGAIAPDGTATAFTINEDTAVAAVHSTHLPPALTASNIMTLSVYAKNINARYVGLAISTTSSNNYGTVEFDLDGAGTVNRTAVAGTGFSIISSSITAVGSGWFRSVAVIQLGSAIISDGRSTIYVSNGAGSFDNRGRVVYTGTSRTLEIWGAQLEQSSTVGEYIPTTSTINSAPRFDHNPTTGESLGLLVEEARTNLSQQSEDFSNVYWAKTDCTITANESTAPDGTTTADLWTNILSAGGAINNSITKDATARTYTSSMWVKGTATLFTFTLDFGGTTNRGRAQFNLATNTVIGLTNTGNFTNTTATITAYSNGWARLTMTTTTSTGTTIRFRPFFGTGGESVLIWGAQVEEGAFATSYIPTTSATVTRAADVASITGTNFGVTRTNYIRNNTMVGAVAGTPGTLPTNWGTAGNAALSTQIVETGTDNGINYIDVRCFGTTAAVATPEIYFNFDVGPAISVAQNQTWTTSCYAKIVGGTQTGIVGGEIYVLGLNSSSVLTEAAPTNFNYSSLTGAFSTCRVSKTYTFTAATTVYSQQRIDVNFSASGGTVVDFTLRIGMPQMELGSVATAAIPTTSAAASVFESSWYNQTEGTVFANTSVSAVAPATSLQTQYAIHDGSADNRITVYKRANADTSARLDISAATVSSAFLNAGTFGLNNLTASAVQINNFAISLNGLTAVADTAGNLPSVNQMNLGSYVGATGFLNGTIKRLVYWGQRLPNNVLQAITQ